MTEPSTTRNDRTLHDLLLRVVGPILVMLMVGSLVYFLIEVFYRGPHDGRLRWVFGLFTLATVLVSRIAIEDGLERASLFGFGLGIATLLTGMRLVDFDYGPFAILEPLVLGLFILVVMWSANRLTWDCTLIDESRDVSAIGLIDIVKRIMSRSQPIDNSGNQSVGDISDSAKAERSSPNKFLFLLFAGSKTRNTPGLWVLYFSLAAFPIFGLGQWFAQRDPDTGYWWIFVLFAVYLGSGLGLLMLTSLLGLERYLRKRGARMPTAVMRNWLIVGTLFALAIMMAVVMMPRPNLSSQLDRSLAFLISPDRGPSKLAVGKDGQKEGGRPAHEKVVVDPNAPASKQNKNNSKTPTGAGGKSSSKSGQKQHDSKSQTASNASQGSPSKSEKSKSQPENESKANSQPDKTPDQSERQNNKGGDSKAAKQQQPAANDQNKRAAENKNVEKNVPANPPKREPGQGNVNKKQQRPEKKGRQVPAQANPRAPNSFANAGRYLTYLIGLVIIAILIWMFRKELAEFWDQLFKKPAAADSEKAESIVEPPKSLPGFGTFREPFKSGLAEKWTNAQIIQYTFAALEAWAYERQHAREEDETPFEFANQLAGLNEAISLEARQLAEMHGRCLFGDGAVSKSETWRLTKLWKLMARETNDAPS